MSKYIVKPHNAPEFTVEADRVERDTTSGFVNFYAGGPTGERGQMTEGDKPEELVASYNNISFRKEVAQAE